MSALADPVAAAVREGLDRPDKRLPPWLLYDAAGCELFERITRLDTYYPTRAERRILEEHAEEIAVAAAPVHELVELGAGTATKSEILLAALLRRGEPRFLPVDVAPEPLARARARLARRFPFADVLPTVGTNEAVLARLSPGPGRLLAFLGSSVGNLDTAEAIALFRAGRRVAGGLLLGADLRKAPEVLVRAYDDVVTERFVRNVLTRLGRELGATFVQEAMRYVVTWNAAESRIELALESVCEQRVDVPAIGLTVRLHAGERIAVEHSRKYDLPGIDALLAAAGFRRVRAWTDPDGRFLVTLAV